MAGAEGVVLAFTAAQEAAQPALAANGVHGVPAPGQDLVRVGLVSDIPDQPVVRGIEHAVQGDRQLHRSQAGREVAAGVGNRFNQEFA